MNRAVTADDSNNVTGLMKNLSRQNRVGKCKGRYMMEDKSFTAID